MVINSDTYLVKRACRGERGAFDQIVENNKKKVFYFAYNLTGSIQDAEDLSQEVFLKAYRSLDLFKGGASLSSWLYRITLNAFIDKKRKLSFKIEKEQQPLEECEWKLSNLEREDAPLSVQQTPEDHASAQQIQVHIDAALECLSPKERAVFVMRHYQGLSGKQTGDLLSISEGTVKSLLFRAIKKLQQQLSYLKETAGSRSREVLQ